MSWLITITALNKLEIYLQSSVSIWPKKASTVSLKSTQMLTNLTAKMMMVTVIMKMETETATTVMECLTGLTETATMTNMMMSTRTRMTATMEKTITLPSRHQEIKLWMMVWVEMETAMAYLRSVKTEEDLILLKLTLNLKTTEETVLSQSGI